MRSKPTAAMLVVAIIVLAATPGTAAPLHSASLRDFVAGPCVAGASYDPACDVNYDGVINVLDVQLAAGHWNQSGTWLSDNDHNHLGQTWTGSNTPLKIQGSFGTPDYAPLVLSNNGGVGLRVASASTDGVNVTSAGYDGVFVREATNWAGRFIGNVSVSGNCVGCRQASFALNTGDRALQPGDAVSIQAVTLASFDAATLLWQVTQAQSGQSVVGVVAGWAELVADESDAEPGDSPRELSQHLAPREGAALPGEYVTVAYSGPMQVRAAPGERALAAGARVTAAADGTVRPLATRTVGGMVVSEGAPVLGIALEPAEDGLVRVLVNPQ